MKVFVYGTLKSGYGNNRLLTTSTLIGPAIVENVKLHHAGFPVARESKGDVSLGELWDIGDDKRVLSNLDSLEGEGRMYNRKEFVVKTLDGISHPASMYIGHPDFWGYADGEHSSIDGRWSSRLIPPCPKNEDGQYVWGR
jgi:gamma-glutamylcyclotransferase (GGCT)/AIG2-like uncharacterized protein YtfP